MRFIFLYHYLVVRIEIAKPSFSPLLTLPSPLTFWLAPKSNKKGARKLKRTLSFAITVSTASKSAERRCQFTAEDRNGRKIIDE